MVLLLHLKLPITSGKVLNLFREQFLFLQGASHRVQLSPTHFGREGNPLQCSAMQCKEVWYSPLQYNDMQRKIVRCSIMWSSAMQCNNVCAMMWRNNAVEVCGPVQCSRRCQREESWCPGSQTWTSPSPIPLSLRRPKQPKLCSLKKMIYLFWLSGKLKATKSKLFEEKNLGISERFQKEEEKHRKNCECCPCHSLFKGHCECWVSKVAL